MTGPSQSDGAILVPIANRETADRQLDTAIDIAHDTDRGILLVHVVWVPNQIPLTEGHQLVKDENRALLTDATETVREHDVPAGRSLRIARSVSSGILTAIEDHEVGTVLAGWRGRPPRESVLLGGYIDRVLREADCDVLVQRIRSPRSTVESILVPVAGGPHTEFAVETAASIARTNDATVHLLSVVSSEADETSRSTAEALLSRNRSALKSVQLVERELAEGESVAGTITDRTAHHDLTVLGVSRGGVFQCNLLGTISQSIGGHAEGTVIFAKRATSARSRLRRLLR